MDVKNYLKRKWAVLKPILSNGIKVIWALTKDAFVKIGRFIGKTFKALGSKIWKKLVDIGHEIKTQVLLKELKWFENKTDKYLEKTEALEEKLSLRIVDLPDAEGDLPNTEEDLLNNSVGAYIPLAELVEDIDD